MHVADAVKQYAVDLVTATRSSPDLRLGASPRATLQLRARRPGARPRSTAATTSSPTTCRRSPSRCSRTG